MFKKELSDGRKVAENSGEWKFFQRADLGLPKVLSYIHIPVSAEKSLCGLPRGLQNCYEPVTALYLLFFPFRMGVFNVPTLFIDILGRGLGMWWSLGYLVQSSPILMEMLIYILDSEMEAAHEQDFGLSLLRRHWLWEGRRKGTICHNDSAHYMFHKLPWFCRLFYRSAAAAAAMPL